MKAIKTEIEGLIVIEPDVYKDERGFFTETFNKVKYKELGIDYNFVQDNLSYSVKNTLRGLHYQIGDFAQGKLCQVVKGKVLDIAVDIRFGSPTFGSYLKVELSDENMRQFWIPPGFAHGFAVISDEAIFTYKCTANYSKEHERSILYSDTDLAIDWEIKSPIVSEKDLAANSFKNIEKDFIYNNQEVK